MSDWTSLNDELHDILGALVKFVTSRRLPTVFGYVMLC